MLRSERAQERLKEFQLDDGDSRRSARVQCLPAELRQTGLDLLSQIPYPRGVSYSSWEEARVKAACGLDSCSPEQLRQLFDALFPRLGTHVVHAWYLFARLPYQSGSTRKPFRSLHGPLLGNWARAAWLYDLLRTTERYEQDLAWFAAWAPYLGWYARGLGVLFAGAIDEGGPEGSEVFDILVSSARGEHEIGVVGRHVIQGLLVASRPDGWELIEGLLLAAQGQEGLRQVILETVDEAHPIAFRRILRLILDHGLTRFSSTVRAVDVWLGFGWEVEHRRQVERAVARVLTFLDEVDTRTDALAKPADGEDLYLALWSHAFEDAPGAIEPAKGFLQDDDVERRYAATYLLAELALVEAQQALVPALEDEDLRVATQALLALRHGADEEVQEADLFEQLERLIERCPRQKRELDPIVWPWSRLVANRQTVAHALTNNLGGRSPRRLIPYLPAMAADDRARVVSALAPSPDRATPGAKSEPVATIRRLDAESRDTLLALAGDPSAAVRERAIRALAQYSITEPEAPRLEVLLRRKPADLRRGVLRLLLNQEDPAALTSARRLTASSHAAQRLAGLEVLRELAAQERSLDDCRRAAHQYRAAHADRTEAEETLLTSILDREAPPTLDDALGLLNPAQRTRPTPPVAIPDIRLETNAVWECLTSLDELIHAHRGTSVKIRHWDDSTEQKLLGSVRWLRWPRPQDSRDGDLDALPMRELWETWWTERPASLRDPDGFELLRAVVVLRVDAAARRRQWAVQPSTYKVGATDLRYPDLAEGILTWLLWLRPPAQPVDFLLDAISTTFAQVPEDLLAREPSRDLRAWDLGWREDPRWTTWLDLARWHRSLFPRDWLDKHHRRLWHLVRWMDEPGTPVSRHRPNLADVVAAYRAGAATEADVLDQLFGPQSMTDGRRSFHDLRTLTTREGTTHFNQCPALRELVDRCRQRIIEVELARGDLPTAASAPARDLQRAGGIDALVPLLQAHRAQPFLSDWHYGFDTSKSAVFSHLIQVTFPEDSDSAEVFTARVETAGLPRKQLIDLAVYAPQWAGHVERALNWPLLEDAVWWLYAHTKDTQGRVNLELRDAWAARVAERTPLAGQALLDGAVDVAWFKRVYGALGPERWAEIDAAAKYAADNSGYKRAQLFANAMRGHTARTELVGRVTNKRHGDAVRALGLLPLAEGDGHEADILDRYRIIQDFVRTSRQFGSQRQASEKLAASIGLENLARTAGYPDPGRLQWAMEAETIADLAHGPVTATAGEVLVSLAIDEWGEPQLTATKGGKALRAVPPAAKKDATVATLLVRKREVDRQLSRMRVSLEQAMCRGDQFTGGELRQLLEHPLLRPMLGSLIFVGADAAGYPVDGGDELEAHGGRRRTLGQDTPLRIAHPHDLLSTGEWHLWQQDCFRRERIQPFKQVFRELYVLTGAEVADGTCSRRYAGHQVNPRRALALLGKRGWVARHEEGVFRTFHDQDLTAWVTFLDGVFTPAEVEGLTIETVQFSRRTESALVPIADIPPRVFSEVMRDLDLVVSVAHQGGVDPEASASTVEMRASLLREACGLLKLENVRLQGAHALIEGTLADYSVHLGSAVVHRQPGGALCIVPVHAQQRGRLFLPFADDDPKTAEVVSKVVLLSRDEQIKDPEILEQLLPV